MTRISMPTEEACLNCSRYSNCNNPKKAFSYRCADKYKPMNYAELEDHLSYNKTSKKSPKNVDKLLEDAEVRDEFNISRIVNQVLSSKSIVPVDIRIDDRDIPKAANFFEFCAKEHFLSIKPYLEQVIIGTMVFSEYCPRCSDMEWLLHTHKVTDTLRRFKKRVALLEYGECPYCGTTKSKLVKKEELNYYQEMAIVAGQRCVTGDTLVYANGKRVRIDSLDNNYDYGFTEAQIDIFNGEYYETTSHFFKARPEPIYKIETTKGFCIKGTCDHPILTSKGFVKLSNIRVDDDIVVGTKYLKDAVTSKVCKISILEPEITYDFTLPETHRFWSDGIYSHNSGKSALTAMMFAYLVHKIVMLSKPNEVYGLLHSSTQHISVVALSYNLARDLLYSPLYAYFSETVWFQRYHEILKDYERRTGESIFKLNDTFLMYRHRALLVAPVGPDRRTLRGKTRIGASIDEIAYFDNSADTQKIKLGAAEVYIALERSLLTIRSSANKLLAKGFNDVPTGYFLNISSPYSVRDKVMELFRQSQNSKKIYGVQKPTWSMNPTITFEDLSEEFRVCATTAWRDYGAQPPLQSNAFITSEAHVQSCMTGKKSNAIKLSFAQKRYKNNDAERYAKITHIGKCNYPSVLAFDAGVVNNSFSFVCGHMDEEDENFVPTIITEIMPLPGIPLNFTLIYENVITEIIESQNVVLVTADRWNSIKILSDIRQQFDIQTEQYSLKYKDMWFAKNYITEGKIILPKCEKAIKECIEYDIDNYPYAFENKPIEHLILQMLTVRDTGNAVIKGDGNLTDDIFRALCLALHRIKDPKHEELFAQAYEETTNFSPGHLAVVRGGSNTATASSVSLTASSGRVLAVSRRSKS